MRAHVLVLAKEPLPGRVKTRLSPVLSHVEGASLARAALLDTLDAVRDVPGVHRTVVLDGSPAGWLPAGLAVLPQRAGDLGDRLTGAFDDAFTARPLPTLLLGMDTPQVTPELIGSALDALLSPGTDAVLGRAEDGGWWALGLRRPLPGLFDGVPMSTDRTGAAQQDRLDALGARSTGLPVLRDVDLPDDVAAVAALQQPAARFAALARELGVLSTAGCTT